MIKFDRAIFTAVIVAHTKNNLSNCRCGWSDLGKSHAEHVADVYERAMAARDKES